VAQRLTARCDKFDESPAPDAGFSRSGSARPANEFFRSLFNRTVTDPYQGAASAVPKKRHNH
jgi:hypothetical protein